MEDDSLLYVDDDRTVLMLATIFFEREGMTVHCAATGEEALEKLRERSFPLMLTDFNMPGMDGIELAEKAREMAPHMPIFMITGDISPEIVRLAGEAGIARVFAKPFDLEDMVAMVERILQAADGAPAC
jgi:two-component system, cell cycle response regulator CpdR